MPYRFALSSAALALALALHCPNALLAQTSLPTVVVIPTIGYDHQFDLDYSVAHLAALLDVVGPEALIVDDATRWLARGCPLNTSLPEIHVALGYANERRIPIFGVRDWPPPRIADPFAAAVQASQAWNERYRDTARAHAVMRAGLDERSAFIAREYSLSSESRGLEWLIAEGFAGREAAMTATQRASIAGQAAALADSVMRLVSTTEGPKRWVVVFGAALARPLADILRTRADVRVVPIDSFLPLRPERLERRLDYRHLSWIVAANLDEWYGMWAPQSFASARVTRLLRRLGDIAPGDPVTEYLRARWYMQYRDYAAAGTILARLAVMTPDVRFPFPVNGKWLRPPWNSVRRKAQLNLAFVRDYTGNREEALALYRELLSQGDELNAEARFFGYLYDDIRSILQSYVDRPYSGMPTEAYRHFAMTARRPECEP